MSRFLKFVMTAAIAAVGVVRVADAGVVFDNTAGEAGGAVQLSTNLVSSWNYGAQQFNSGFNDQLSSLSLSLFRVGSGGTYAVELWSNTVVSGSAVPNALVATLGSGSTSSLPASPGLVTFNPATTISPVTNYWVVFNATGVGPGQAYWNYTADATGAGVAGTAFVKTDDGDGWNSAYGDYRGIMSVMAVPEPSAYALVVAGFGIAVFVRARRRGAAGVRFSWRNRP